ncbi:M23 family metallopeptidase [Proteiniclasticum sp.]|uniref:M23 family metallopeptidase n=1 Tax=Proteiniclasticum sp. TaxID=2053595 RepID=UPI0028A20119|nr:M23 family metallopeptidase [Proteiniclasticum sp.]
MKPWSKAVATALVILAIGSFPNVRVLADENSKTKLNEVVAQIQTLEEVKTENERLVETRINEIETIGQAVSVFQDRIGFLNEEKVAVDERVVLLEELKPTNLLQAAVLTIARAYTVLDEAEINALIHGELEVYETYENQYLHQDTYREIEEALLLKRAEIEENILQVEALMNTEMGKKEQYTNEVTEAQRVSEETNVTLTALSVEKITLEDQIKKEEAVRKSTTFIWPTSGRFTSPFGYRIHPISRTRRMHTGIDIANSSGTNIAASQNGKVIFTGYQGSYGKLIVIRHANGMETAYAHLSRISVSVGDTVTQGQSIGKMGSTGGSTGSNLHFEIRKNGTAVNPMNYLK